jgi:branched-chain amino acid transport system permease protein
VSSLLAYLTAGVASGCAFALVAIGFVVIYRVTRVVNFAQGAFAVLGGFAAWSLLGRGVPHGLAEVAAVALAVLAGLLVGLVAIGRQGTAPMTSLIVTLGLGIASYALIILLWGDQPVSFTMLRGAATLGAVGIQRQYVLVILATLLALGALAFFFGRTYLGKGMTACSSNPYAARLMGIDVRRMGLLAFGLGGGLGGLAGVLLTPLQPVSFDSDVGFAVNGFAAAVFGGVLRPGAALAGGLVLGIAEALVAGYHRATYQSAIALCLMLAIMVWRATRQGEVEQ